MIFFVNSVVHFQVECGSLLILLRSNLEILKNIGIERIYCINLDRRSDRWERMKKRFDKYNLEITRIQAIDNRMKIVGDIIRTGKCPSYRHQLIGCTLSHIRAIEDAIKNGHKKILVFEDDVVFLKNWMEIFRKYIVDDLKNRCSLFMLDATPYANNGDGLVRCFDTHHTGGYYINKRSMHDLVTIFHKSNTFIDIESLLSLIESKSKSPLRRILGYSNCYTSTPRLCIQEKEDSDIWDEETMIAHEEIHNSYRTRYKNDYDFDC